MKSTNDLLEAVNASSIGEAMQWERKEGKEWGREGEREEGKKD